MTDPIAYLEGVSGQRIGYCYSPGRSPGVMFCGGFMSDMTGGKALALEHWCRVHDRAFVRFDYNGHGCSDGKFADGTISSWRDDALAVLDRICQGDQIIVGSSMGGWIMLLLARARPERIRGLIGIATATDMTEQLLWARLSDHQRDIILRNGLIQLPSEYSDIPYTITRQLIEDGRDHRILNGTLTIDAPVRLLHGMQDPDVPWQHSLQLVPVLSSPDVRVTLIKDGDHRLSRPADLALLTAQLAGLLEQSP